jgi:nitroreductase
MEFKDVLRGRRSIRRFLPRPVPDEVVREILGEARWSPSWANTQAWHVSVVTGESLRRLAEADRTAATSEAPAGPDFRMPRVWPEHLAARTRRLFELRSSIASPAGADAEATGPAAFYGAPCVLFVTVEAGLETDYALFDCGILVQSLCLAAHDKGLGTCIMAMAVRDPDGLRAVLPHAAAWRFVIGVALGYPDEQAEINRFDRERAPLDEIVTWAE